MPPLMNLLYIYRKWSNDSIFLYSYFSFMVSFIHHDKYKIIITKLFTPLFPSFYAIMQLQLQDYWQILFRCTQTWPWPALTLLFMLLGKFLNVISCCVPVLWLYFESFWFGNASYCILSKIKHYIMIQTTS